MSISFLYMFRATMCPSSGEIAVPMGHFVFVNLCGWLSGTQGGISPCIPRQSSIQSDGWEVSHRYSYFSWWWAHSHPKHVEKRNKHAKKICAPSWPYLQDYTGMHGQPNIKFTRVVVGIFCISMNIVLQQCVKFRLVLKWCALASTVVSLWGLWNLWSC